MQCENDPNLLSHGWAVHASAPSPKKHKEISALLSYVVRKCATMGWVCGI